jgi:hypothetical protein
MIKKLLLCSLALFLTLLTHAQNVPSYVPTNGLVGWWPFNGNANDESGNGNNGTVNGATLGLDRNGNSNAAYQFDGNGDYIDVNDNPALRLANSNYTVQLWAKFNTFANQDLIRKDNAWSGSGTTNGYAFTTANTNNLFVWHWPANTGPIYSMSASTWYHIVYIYDTSTQTFKLFVNSVLTSTQNLAPVSATSVNDKMRIGGGWTNWWHNGAIDDIGYWNSRRLPICIIPHYPQLIVRRYHLIYNPVW